MKIMSFNLRNANDADGHSIAERAPRILQVISDFDADLLGLQEYGDRINDKIYDTLIEKYCFFEQRTSKGISSPILWKKDAFECLENGYFRLSATPNVQSVSFDDKYNEERLCLWVMLKDKQTEKSFVYMNTHFGVGIECIKNSPEAINEYSKRFSHLPVIITGDFNMSPESVGYKNMTKFFTDVNAVTAKDTRYTFHSYNTSDSEKRKLIDYCFINGNVTPKAYKMIDSTFDGKYPSDHHAITAIVTLN